MALQDDFQAAKEKVGTLPEKPSNDVLLKLYGLFKQGSEGDNNMEQPAMFDFVKQAKYNAWEGLRGTSKQEAQLQYITFVDSLFA